ncbi:type I-C CRISPR-associated protein Cas8c/Csd1 [Clostridium sp.]|uniref:type I-C CRISPR-associated protein Cas8c/Csd1 n=1 Tax=Clostridium sp. TaxID=1506 RepID=UPI003216F225
MILQDLYDYYNILDSEGVKDLPKENTSMQKISFALVISKEGKLSGIIDLREQSGKKVVSSLMVVPEQLGRSGKNAPSYFLCDNAKYVLGIGDKDGNPCFNSFKEMHNRCLDKESPICKFINSWIPEEYESNNIINQYIKDLTPSCNIVFKLEGETGYYHEKNENLENWKRGLVSKDDEIMQCLITGKVEPVARIHTAIKGVKNAHTAGAKIVSFKDDCFKSYGKKDSYNAPISKSAMFKYTTVLNYLIRSEKNRIIIGDNTVVFWAEKKGIYEDLLLELINPTYEQEENESITTDKETRELTKDILMKYSMGLKLNQEKYGIDIDTKVHILGLASNESRLSIAFYEVNTFDYFTTKIAQHYKDLNIIGNDKSIPIWMILSETIPKTSKDKKVSPVLSKSLMNSIFRGVIYPSSLYNAMISRIRADKDINYKRAAIIKACLNRRYRLYKEKEEMTVSLNEESKSIPYQLGRLFAVLEKAQKEAIPNLNTTIKDSYFTSASATPASVFPILIKLSFHHTKKAEYGTNLEIRKNKIIDKIDSFPKHLSLEEQGEFILGYYHQNQDFYKPQGGK